VECRQLERSEQEASLILFLFLSHLGVGILWTLAFVSRGAGVKFFRFNAGLAAVLIAIGLAFSPDFGQNPAGRIGFSALVACEAAALLYWATVGRSLAAIRPAILGGACAAGVIALIGQALGVADGRPVTMQTLAVASFLSSAGFLGGACTAMILGHWYLVIPSLEVSHLQSIVKLHIVSMVIRIAVVTAAVVFAIVTWQPGLGPSFERYILSVSGVFFWQRVLFGLAGPALLSYLTWETAKIRSTQSATGILYVDFFTVVVGEVLAKYLLLATRVPV
jgi:protein NrfD